MEWDLCCGGRGRESGERCFILSLGLTPCFPARGAVGDVESHSLFWGGDRVDLVVQGVTPIVTTQEFASTEVCDHQRSQLSRPCGREFKELLPFRMSLRVQVHVLSGLGEGRCGESAQSHPDLLPN